MKLTLKERKLVKEYAKKLVGKKLNEEKEYDIMDIADDLRDRYPNAYHFYMYVYSTSMFERAAKKLDTMVSGDLLPMKVYEDTFGTLESLLKP